MFAPVGLHIVGNHPVIWNDLVIHSFQQVTVWISQGNL